jgi:hypothetical protein
MRNFPLVPNQQAQTEAQILANVLPSKTEKVAFKSSVDNTYKAYEMANGEYIKWTMRGFATEAEALEALEKL